MCFLYLISPYPTWGRGGKLFEYYKRESRLKKGWQTLSYSEHRIKGSSGSLQPAVKMEIRLRVKA